LAHRRHRHREGAFLVDGLQLLHLGLAAGQVPRVVFHCPSLFAGPGAPALLARCRQTSAQVIEVSTTAMASLSDRDAPQGLVAVFPLIDRPLASLHLPADSLVLVLDRLQNPGNLGTLVRTADALGAGAVVRLEPGADPHDPIAVRATMGSLFNLPLAATPDLDELVAWLRHQGVRLVAADPYQGHIWHQADWSGGVALVLGNEARGLSAEWRPRVDAWVRLPMRASAESLNVAVAGGVLGYAWLAAHTAAADPATPDRR
jgi:TrmH family RNA methyltransferase